MFLTGREELLNIYRRLGNPSTRRVKMKKETTLTDEEIIAIGQQARAIEGGENGYILPVTFARAIEQAVLKRNADAKGTLAQVKRAYTINFARQNCIEAIDDDGRPAFKRLRKLGVLFDSRQDAEDWLLYCAGVGTEVKESGYYDKDVILEGLLNIRYYQRETNDLIESEVRRLIAILTERGDD